MNDCHCEESRRDDAAIPMLHQKPEIASSAFGLLAMTTVLLCLVAFSGCGKKEKTDIIADLESKPIVTEVKPEDKPAAKEPSVVDNSANPSSDIQESQPQTAEPSAPAASTNEPAMPQSPTDSTASSANSAAPAASGQTYEVSAQKVDPNASPISQEPATPPAPQAPYPPYQGQQGAPQYQNPYGAPPPNPYYGYAPPQKYKPPGPIESTGEFIGHLVNPFKRKEDESKKTYKGY